MTRVFLCFLFFLEAAHAFVPTVESLFRFGGNPDVTVNGVMISVVVRRFGAEGASGETLLADKASEEYYRIFLSKAGSDALKISQARFKDSAFADTSLDHKVYNPNFTPLTMKSPEQVEKGLFYALLHSLSFNNGSQMVTFLKGLNVPVKDNNEIINREKIEHLTEYKRYLINIGQNRAARKTEANPLRPEDPAARERIESIMNESMYVDTGHVKLGQDENQMAWLVTASPFEGAFSYKERAPVKYKYKGEAGEFSVHAREYWLPNGTHYFPRYMDIRSMNGAAYQLEIVELKHYVEREEDIVRRQKRWDQLLKGKESSTSRPEFLL